MVYSLVTTNALQSYLNVVTIFRNSTATMLSKTYLYRALKGLLLYMQRRWRC